MGAQDPITRVVFHSTKTEVSRGFSIDHDAKPLRQKVFVFWNPDSTEDLQDQVTLTRLMLAFKNWADKQVDGEAMIMPSLPSRCRWPSATGRRRSRRRSGRGRRKCLQGGRWRPEATAALAILVAAPARRAATAVALTRMIGCPDPTTARALTTKRSVAAPARALPAAALPVVSHRQTGRQHLSAAPARHRGQTLCGSRPQ
eukprot:SRR837773.20743.p1 GENE.SRR837773.20743~~SRR837773.20743.p1  ORF type:complete len:229 (-),score=29.52 SRR837773.20743:756-1358(-)